MWSASPLSPYSAAASGMPTCTVLPNEAVIARTLGAAAAPASPRERRRGRVDEQQHGIVGTKKASTMRDVERAKSIRAVVRNSSAGTKM